VTALLLALRFVLELCLLAAMVIVGWAAFDSHLAGAVVGLGLAVVVGAVWGVLLSPRRRIDLPLAVRVIVELILFVTAAAGLAAVGHLAWGAALLVAEVVVLVALALRGLPPGTDVGAGQLH
jgi:hypothetical protein